jgi:hypothetical protein
MPIKCEYCHKEFIDCSLGLAQKTSHEICHEPEVVNQ